MKGTKFLSSKAILGIVTAVAVVVTVAGSFAAWDTLNNQTSASSTALRVPVTLDSTSTTFLDTANNNTLGDVTDPSFSGNVEYTLAGLAANQAYTLTITPTVTASDSASITSTDYTLTIGESTYDGTNAVTVNVEAAATAPASKSVPVSLTMKDGSTSLSGKTISVSLATVLSKKQ